MSNTPAVPLKGEPLRSRQVRGSVLCCRPFFSVCAVVIPGLLAGACTTHNTRADTLNDALADEAVAYCLWSVYDSYGELSEETFERVRFTCESDYMRYLDWKWEVTSE